MLYRPPVVPNLRFGGTGVHLLRRYDWDVACADFIVWGTNSESDAINPPPLSSPRLVAMDGLILEVGILGRVCVCVRRAGGDRAPPRPRVRVNQR